MIEHTPVPAAPSKEALGWGALPLLMMGLVAPVGVLFWYLEKERKKMRAQRIETFKNKARSLGAFPALPIPLDGSKHPEDILAEMYADLGQERDDFESKAKHADALRAEAGDFREKFAAAEKKCAELEELSTKRKLSLNAIYGKLGYVTPHASVKGVDKLVRLLKIHSDVREKAIGKLGVRALRKLLSVALHEIISVGQKLTAESTRANLAFEQGIEEERVRSTAKIQHLSERSDKVDEKIKETDARLALIKEMLLDYQKQRDGGLAREAKQKQDLYDLKIAHDDLVIRLSRSREYAKSLLSEKAALITLYRAQGAIVDQHLDQGEQSGKVP